MPTNEQEVNEVLKGVLNVNRLSFDIKKLKNDIHDNDNNDKIKKKSSVSPLSRCAVIY